MMSGGITPGPVRIVLKIHIFEESRHIHSFSYPEIDMTSILGSFPASFLEAHQSGSEPGFQLLPSRLNFGCHFQKPWWSYWCLLCFNNWCGKKVQINLPKRVSQGCNESRCLAGCHNCESHFKEPEHPFLCWVTEMKHNQSSLWKRKHSHLWKYAMGASVKLWKWLFHTVFWFLFISFFEDPASPLDFGVDRLEAWLKDWMRAIDDET